MNTVCRDIFRAVHEGKWLSIEYKNGKNEITKYWIGIISINPIKKSMEVQGLHLAQYTIRNLYVFIDSIQSSCVIEGSYFEPNQKLIDDINQNPVKYKRIFDNVANLKILNYLIDCNKMDSVPYKTDYALIDNFDGEWNGNYKLDENQFRQIVTKFQYKTHDEHANKTVKQLAINVLSINTSKGLYVLAYRKLRLDVAKHMMRQDDEITICMEFALEKNKTEELYEKTKDITIFDSTLEKNKDDKTKRTAELTKLLEKHNVLNTNNRCVVQKEVSIAHVFQENTSYDDLFYTGRFDFVVYEKGYKGQDIPILAIELDGKEHRENSMVKARDEMKNKICKEHGFELIRVENSYARRYNYIKNILIQYFKSVR